jgi:predicted DnaQ family exonuclease/DinG family helicase
MISLFNFVALDIETTGFDFEKNEIIEIGAVRYISGKIKDKFSIFIKPQKPVPQFIKQLTNITDEQLNSGDTLSNALSKLLEFLGTDLVVCHNTSFDIGFLNTKYEKINLPKLSNQIIDTLDLSRIYLPFIVNHKLGTVAEYFNINLSNAHRAIFDAEATGMVLIGLLKFIEDNIPLKVNHKLLELSFLLRHQIGLSRFLEKIVEHQKKYALLEKTAAKIDFHNRNYIEHKPKNPAEITIDMSFRLGGLFNDKFEKYEIRQGQIDMSHAVLENFNRKEFLLVEAGTGVGKSLAYLVPSVMFTHKNKNKKIIISTNTKNLQEQLFYKDLPTVKECIQLPFKATLLKGRRNYVCEKKWLETNIDLERILSFGEIKSFMNLIVWKEFTRTGDISENSSFDVNRDSSVWKRLSADTFLCRGKRCPHYKQCFLMDIRKKAEDSNLVIINHYLLLADMQIDNATLGEFDNLIIDEAHNLPHIAPAELGLSLSYADFNNFFAQLYTIRKKFQSGILIGLKTAAMKSDFPEKTEFISKIEDVIKLLEEKKSLFSEFFKKVGDLVNERGSYGKLRIKNLEDHEFLTDHLGKIIIFWQEFSKAIMPLQDALGDINKQRFIDYDKHKEIMESVVQTIGEYYNTLNILYNPDLKEFAYWMESFQTYDEKYPSGVLCYCPLNVNQIFNDKLYSRVDSIIFTSATMAIRDKFKYFSGRMGLDLLEEGFVQELIVQSPFNYKKQTMVLVAGVLPDPKDKFFSAQSIEIIKNAVEVSRAGTMVLFTAYKNLNEVYEVLSEPFYNDDILLLAQGKGIGRSAMLKEFREHRNSVLLGTNSFWEGVDVPGESLELLILYKLPFMVPSEPIVEAFLEKLEAEGKDSFLHYMLPNALLKYRQGFGRLIRHKTDRGVVLVLDNRILTKRYGQYFKDTVPANTHITTTDVEIYDYLVKWFKKI